MVSVPKRRGRGGGVFNTVMGVWGIGGKYSGTLFNFAAKG